MENRGKLISVNGMDGSGKTTIINVIKDILKQKKIMFKIFKMPDNDYKKLKIFKIHTNDFSRAINGGIDLTALCLVLFGARLMTYRTEIRQIINEGTWVICDRYGIYTAIAELTALGYKKTDIDKIIYISELLPEPDLNILTTAGVGKIIDRIKKRKKDIKKVIRKDIYANIVNEFENLAMRYNMEIINTDEDILKNKRKVIEILSRF